MLRNEEDYESYFEDTMRAGHYENRKESVDIMIRNSQSVIRDLIGYGVQFQRASGNPADGSGQDTEGEGLLKGYAFTREGAHSRPRILFHEDVTGKEITSRLLAGVRELDNVEIWEYTAMTDIIVSGEKCRGIIAEEIRQGNGGQGAARKRIRILAKDTIIASGGIGGRYEHSTNFPHLTGDALVIAKKHGGIAETFTVRRVSYGVGVEKVFPLHSPVIEKIETVRKGKVRRAKLYYLRDRVGKSAKVKERI